jgi:chromosome condensin MukBEF ATPase and DNA-binding subunit MukB
VGEGRQSGRRVTVDEAARHLGLTVDAVRKRVQRGQIEHEKDAAGRVRIILDIPDNTSTLQDERPDTTGQDPTRADAREELVDELRARVAFLERELERRSGEAERYQQIVAGLTQANTEQARAIRAIEAPQEPPESAETVEEEPDEDVGVEEGVDEHDRPEGEVGRDEEPSIAELREMFVKNRKSQSSSETQQRPQGGLRGLRRRLLGW